MMRGHRRAMAKAAPRAITKEPSIAHGIPQWEQPQKMTMVSEKDDAPLIASPRRKPKESGKKISATPNAYKERPSQGGEEPIIAAQRQPSNMVISFNREDSCCMSLGDLTCDQSEIPLFQEQGNSIQQQRYSTAGGSPVPGPRRKPNHLSTAANYQSPQKYRPEFSSSRRGPQKGSKTSPRKESHSPSPRKTSSRKKTSSPRKPASAGRGGEIVLDVVLQPSYASQETVTEGKKKKQPSSIQKPEAGEIVVNLSQAPLSRESSDVVIPSFGSKTKTSSKKPDVPIRKKHSSGQEVGETDKPRTEKPSKPGTSFFPPAPLHESKNEQSRSSHHQPSSGRHGSGDELSDGASRRREYTTTSNSHGVTHSSTNERGQRRHGGGGGGGGGGGDEMSLSSWHERSCKQHGAGGRDDLSNSSGHERRRHGGIIGSELSQSFSQDRKRSPKSTPAPQSETTSAPSRETKHFAKDAKSTTEIALDPSQMHGSSSSLMGGSAIEISIDCDSSEEGMTRDTCNEDTGIDAEDMALLEQENEMIKYALEQSMHEISVSSSSFQNSNRHVGSEDGLSVISGDGSIQSRHSECRSLHGAYRGKQKKLSESTSRLISVEEPSNTEEDDEFKMVIEMSRQNAMVMHGDGVQRSKFPLNGESLEAIPATMNDSVHGSKFPLNGESLAAIPARMDDSIYTRFDSALGFDASRVSRFNDSQR